MAEPNGAALLLDEQPIPHRAGKRVDKRVFLVEDQKRMESVMIDLFRSIGGFALVASVPTEAQACQWVEENTDAWDLAVVDLMLEQGTGIGVVSRCRRHHPAGKIVVLSSYASPAIRRHCLELGADAVFEKSEYSAFVEFCNTLSNS